MKIAVPKDLGYSPIPDGVYRASITGYKVRTSEKGHPLIGLELTLLTESPDPNVSTVGRKVFTNLTMTEESLWWSNSFFRAVHGKDIPEGEYEVDELINLLTSHLLQGEVLVRIQEGTGPDGRKRSEVREVRRAV